MVKTPGLDRARFSEIQRSLKSYTQRVTQSSTMADPQTEPAVTELSPIESIPEDVVLHLVDIIGSWTARERGGSLEEKEARRK